MQGDKNSDISTTKHRIEIRTRQGAFSRRFTSNGTVQIAAIWWCSWGVGGGVGALGAGGGLQASTPMKEGFPPQPNIGSKFGRDREIRLVALHLLVASKIERLILGVVVGGGMRARAGIARCVWCFTGWWWWWWWWWWGSWVWIIASWQRGCWGVVGDRGFGLWLHGNGAVTHYGTHRRRPKSPL